MRIFQFRTFAALLLITSLHFTTSPVIAEETDPHPKLSLSLSLGKNEAYPGEAVPVTVTLRINDATVRNIGYPRLAAPNANTIAFAPPVQESEAGDLGVILHRFTGQISGAKPGTLIIGPARLDCEVMKSAAGSAAFFGGQESETVQLTSTAATFFVLPLPASGKPEHFSGAVGAFSLSVTSLPAQAAVGEPLTVTTTIRGAGSLADAACPTITDSGLQSFPVEAAWSASQLICEQVVVPNTEMQFPSVTWSFFDPQKQAYRVLSADISSRVIAAPPEPQHAAASPATVNSAPGLKLVGSLNPFLAILVVAVALILLIAVRVRKRNMPASQTALPDGLGDLHKMLLTAEKAALNNDVELFYNIAFEILQNMERVGKHYNGASVPTATQKKIIRLFLSEHTEIPYEKRSSDALKSLAMACDRVRYGRLIPDSTTISADFEFLLQALSSTLRLTIKK